MKERPILFSAPMVRAILAGTKSQTRRALRVQPPVGTEWMNTYHHPKGAERPYWWAGAGGDLLDFSAPCPYGQPGDRLRVKEAAWMWCERRPNGKTKTGRDKWVYVPMREAPIHYAADHPKKPAIDVVSPTTGNTWGWRLKIGRFLPRWASRITLEVTGVRVERLQDISEADAIAEGIERVTVKAGATVYPLGNRYSHDAVEAYSNLWEQINGPESWAANPWVWCVSFRRLEAAC